MRLSSFIARRFLFSPKSHSVINIISRVSMVAVGIPVAAMVILMSVFSGFDDLIRRMYRDFDPDLLVQPAVGKVFDPQALDTGAIAALDGVAEVSLVLEESALLEYRGRQRAATVRGVDSLFTRVVPIEKMMYAGRADAGGAIVGLGIAGDLGIRLGLSEQLRLYVPRRGAYSALLPMAAFSSGEAPVDGVFMLDADTDGEYVLVPLGFAQGLFDYRGRASGLMVRFEEGASEKRLKAAVSRIAGGEFSVLTRYEQKASMYRIMTLEKWGVFFIGLMVLIIASFSIVGSLIMLMIDKRAGIRTLGALGAQARFIRGVFVRQGMVIGTIGAAGGFVLGVAVCAVQQVFGVIPMPGATFLIDSYPVLMRWGDIAVICAAFVAVTYLITTFTVRKMIKAKNILMLAAVALALAACGKPRIVPDDKLALIFHDIYLTNAYVDQHRGVMLDSLNIYEPLFARYGYTSEDLQFTIGSFAKRKSARLSDDVVEKAIEMLRAESRFYNHRIAVADSVSQIARRRFARVVYSDSLIRVRRIADTAGLRIVLPVEEGSYEVAYGYFVDSADMNSNLRTNIYLVDGNGRQSGGSPRRLVSSRQEEVRATLSAGETHRWLVLDLNGYPEKEMKTPSMRIENLTVTRYLPDALARDSMARGMFNYYVDETGFVAPRADSLGAAAE